MKRCVCLLFCCVLAGCGLAERDLAAEGVYRIDATGVGGHLVAVSAVDRGRRLRVTGRLSGGRYRSSFPGAVEVVLASPDGAAVARNPAHLRHVHPSRSFGPYADFQTEFDAVPPPGTLIRVCPLPANPRQNGCGTPPPD